MLANDDGSGTVAGPARPVGNSVPQIKLSLSPSSAAAAAAAAAPRSRSSYGSDQETEITADAFSFDGHVRYNITDSAELANL